MPAPRFLTPFSPTNIPPPLAPREPPPQAIGGTRRGGPGLEDAGARPRLGRGGGQFRRAGHRRDDLEAVRLEQPDESVAEQEQVLADDYAHATPIRTLSRLPGRPP